MLEAFACKHGVSKATRPLAAQHLLAFLGVPMHNQPFRNV